MGVSSLIATHLEQIVQGVYLGSVAYVVVAIHAGTLFPEGRDKAVQDLPCALKGQVLRHARNLVRDMVYSGKIAVQEARPVAHVVGILFHALHHVHGKEGYGFNGGREFCRTCPCLLQEKGSRCGNLRELRDAATCPVFGTKKLSKVNDKASKLCKKVLYLAILGGRIGEMLPLGGFEKSVQGLSGICSCLVFQP